MNLATWNEDEASRHVLGQLITVIDSVRTRAIRSKPGPFRKADPIPVFNPLSLQERHARIEARPDGGGVVIVDAGSSNGTYVNGVRADGPRPLHTGDEVQIGSNRFRVEA